jgi:hypothetical protein
VRLNGTLLLTGTNGTGKCRLDIALPDRFVPKPSDTFQIVDNYGANAVVGAFANDSAGIVGFGPGGQYKCNVTYTGGTGNDIVLSSFRGLAAAGMALLIR